MTEQLLQPEQRQMIEGLVADERLEKLHRRASVLTLYDDGHPTREVAQEVGLSRSQVRYWRRQYRENGLAIFRGVFLTSDVIPSADTREASHPSEAFAQVDIGSTSEPVLSPPEPITTELAPETSPSLGTPAPTAPPAAELLSTQVTLKSPGVEPDDPLSEAGRKVLHFHFGRMLRHEEGTRLGEDIEELHDMRVATRRMRAAFEVFDGAFKPGAIKAHLQGLKATGRALGRVRDLDVFMEKAQIFQKAQLKEHHQGLKTLLYTWEQEREAARERMVTYLDSESYQNFTQKISVFLDKPGAGARSLPKDPLTPYQVSDIVPVLIYTRLSVVRAFDAIMENASIDQLHALRIEFKKLRYTVEFFREVLGKEAKAVINDIKELQDHLGDLNDAQVATVILRDFHVQWDIQQAGLPVNERQSPEPIMAYLSAKYTERHHLMVTFRDAWAHFKRPEFRHNLALAVSVL